MPTAAAAPPLTGSWQHPAVGPGGILSGCLGARLPRRSSCGIEPPRPPATPADGLSRQQAQGAAPPPVCLPARDASLLGGSDRGNSRCRAPAGRSLLPTQTCPRAPSFQSGAQKPLPPTAPWPRRPPPPKVGRHGEDLPGGGVHREASPRRAGRPTALARPPKNETPRALRDATLTQRGWWPHGTRTSSAVGAGEIPPEGVTCRAGCLLSAWAEARTDSLLCR